MFKNLAANESLTQEENIQIYLDEATNICKRLEKTDLQKLNICQYQYTADAAVNELGLDDALIHRLVEDYVIQVLNSYSFFSEYLKKLQEEKANKKKLDFTSLRELAHKNLGVARNLRIKDGEVLLNELMTQEDLGYLQECLLALQACTVRLKPRCAYDTLKNIEAQK